MAERYILDPAEVIAGRTELDITAIMSPDGMPWPATTNAPYYADGDVGQVVIDERWNNREMTVPLRIKDVGGTAFATWRSLLQAKVGEFQAGRGGVLKRIMSSGGTIYADIISARLTLGGDSLQAIRAFDVNASLDFVLSPESYGDWVTLDVMRGTGAIVGVLQQDGADAVIAGDFPPGNRCRIVVTDTSGNDQRGLIAAFRGRNYDGTVTAALSYEAEALTPLDAARAGALTGASGGTVVAHSVLGTDWAPVLGTNIAADDSYLTHVGVYRLRARVHSPSGSAVMLRAVYDVGDLVNPEENRSWTFPGAGQFFDADLGELRLSRAIVGEHRWAGQIQAKGAVGGETVRIDKVQLVPADEFMATAAVSLAPQTARGLAPYFAHDEFNQSAGTLTGKTLPVGGSWVGAGDADDWTVVGAGGQARRSAIRDSASTGRHCLAGTATTAQVMVMGRFSGFETNATPAYIGLDARYVDTSNWCQLVLAADPVVLSLIVRKRVAGRLTVLDTVDIGSSDASPSVAFYASASGDWAAFAGSSPSTMELVLRGFGDADLATGGALRTGRVGIYDEAQGSSGDPSERRADDFAAWVPIDDAVLYANRVAEIRTDGSYRTDQSGTAYAMLVPVGNLPRLPSGTAEILVSQSRGDYAERPDSALDRLSVQVIYQPCWLNVPGE